MSHSWPGHKSFPPRHGSSEPTHEDWETNLKHDAVLITVELGGRTIRRAIPKTLLLTTRYPMMLVSEVLHDPIMDVLGK